MPFYDSIADYYDHIFPLDTRHIDFIRGSIVRSGPGRRVLDVGCGTGDLALALAGLGFEVSAVDSDGAMIEKAREKAGARASVHFRQADMRSLTDLFSPESFDLVLCLGNTLVHLTDLREMDTFLLQAGRVLGEEGKLLLQILNYDHVLDHTVRRLPLIENSVIRFERLYDYDESQNMLAFKTALTVKATGRIIDNSIPLYPLRRQELDGLLKKTGFSGLSYFGDFDRAPLKDSSLPLIVEAVKGRTMP